MQFLYKLILGDDLTTLGYYAFAGCDNLTKVDFSSKPDSIAENAFLDCQTLTEINAHWRIGEIPGAPWGANNAIINYLPVAENVSLNINRFESTDIIAPTGYDSSAVAYIESIFTGDGYDISFVIESKSSTLYLYEYSASDFPSTWKEVNLNFYNAEKEIFYYSTYITNSSSPTFEEALNIILNSPSSYPIESYILQYSEHANDFNVNLFDGMLTATNIVETVGYTYTYSINLSDNLPLDDTKARLTYIPDGTYVEDTIGHSCDATFNVDCYDLYASNDEDILQGNEGELIDNEFLKFAYEKAYPLLDVNFNEPITGVFELSY